MRPTKKDIVDGILWRYINYSADVLYNAKFNNENGAFCIRVHDNWSVYDFNSFQHLFRLHRSEIELEILRSKVLLQMLVDNGVTSEVYELVVELGI